MNLCAFSQLIYHWGLSVSDKYRGLDNRLVYSRARYIVYLLDEYEILESISPDECFKLAVCRQKCSSTISINCFPWLSENLRQAVNCFFSLLLMIWCNSCGQPIPLYVALGLSNPTAMIIRKIIWSIVYLDFFHLNHYFSWNLFLDPYTTLRLRLRLYGG